MNVDPHFSVLFFYIYIYIYEGFVFFPICASTMHLKALACPLKAVYPDVRALPLFWRGIGSRSVM